MKESLDDYNKMFDTHYDLDQITSYNANLNDRLARKIDKFKTRNQQLDLVIVVNRLLTGFDAPCLSTLFVDRPPMHPHDIIQALSRTNRIFDKNKKAMFNKSIDICIYNKSSKLNTVLRIKSKHGL